MCILEEEETAAREVAAAAYTTHPNWTWAKPQEKRGKQRRKNIHEDGSIPNTLQQTLSGTH